VRYVPTVTRIWPRLDLTGVEEVLLTPVNSELPVGPKSLLIDNGCYSINRKTAPVEKLDLHIELCLKLSEDSRCIFILPDIRWDPELARIYVDRFLKTIRPRRYILVDIPHLLESFPKLPDLAECLAIPSNRVKSAHYPLHRYHLLGRDPQVDYARSWDDLLFDSKRPLKDQIEKRSIG
jgi:hypothetical protein